MEFTRMVLPCNLCEYLFISLVDNDSKKRIVELISILEQNNNWPLRELNINLSNNCCIAYSFR